MKVGLVAVDSTIPNLALMKLSAWHKERGDEVDLAVALDAASYDVVYRSKQFDFTPDENTPWDCEVISGGTGYDLAVTLEPKVDSLYPDYGLFNCTFAMGRFSRGCIRRCPWCVVWKQDGTIRKVGDLDAFWRGQKRIRLLDDNLTADRKLFLDACQQLLESKAAVKFEALDIRLMDAEMAAALAKVKRWDARAHFAFDHPSHEAAVRRGIAALKEGGFPLWAASFYVLIGYNTTPEQDLHRVMLLHDLGCESFVMPYDKTDFYQQQFKRWCNTKPIFKKVSWSEYSRTYRRKANQYGQHPRLEGM